MARGADKGADVSLATPVGGRILVFNRIEPIPAADLSSSTTNPRDEESLLPSFPSFRKQTTSLLPQQLMDQPKSERGSCCDVGFAFLREFYTCY